MAQVVTVGGKTLYACPACGYVYRDSKSAEKCQHYCEKHGV